MTTERRDDRWVQWLDTEAAAAAYPATPDLASRVVAAARIERSAPRFAIGRAPRLAVAAVIALVMLAATIAVPPARTAIGEFFGLVQGERIEVLPTPPPDVTPTAFPAPPPLENLGSPYSLEAIAAVVGFAPALPAGELPRAVFLVDYDGATVAVLQYDDFDLWQTRATDYGYFGKGVTTGTLLETPQIGGEYGYWVGGGGHVVRFIDAEGNEVVGSRRTIDRNTLIWRGPTSNVFYRLETSLLLEAAIPIAETLP